MKSLSTNTLFGIALMAIVLAVYAISITTPDAHAIGPSDTTIGVATTSVATSVTTTTRIVATSTNPLDPTNSFIRIYATICTQSTNPVAINLDQDKPANGTTGAVTAWIGAAAGYNTCYEITGRNLYNGSITASSTSQAAAIVTVKQYVQER